MAFCHGQKEPVGFENPHCCHHLCLLWPYLTRRWAFRESLPPAESTRQVYVPMSPDHVCEMCREPFLSRRIRGLVSTARVAPSFSHTYLWRGMTQVGQSKETREFPGWATHTPPPRRNMPKAGRRSLQASHVLSLVLGFWAGSRA